MPESAFHEAIWEALGEDVQPAELQLRRDFLLSNVAAGQRVLDLGCGDGTFAAALVAAGADVVAVDVARAALRRAAARHPELDLRQIAAAGPWELPDSHFDLVWGGEVIEHIADVAGWLSETRRVLRSGGRLLLTTPAHGRLRMLTVALSRRAFAANFDPLGDHLRFFSGPTLAALLGEFGFNQIAVRAAGGPPWNRRVLLASATRARF